MLESVTEKRKVGRPKSLDIIEITKDAMYLFWDKGVQGVSFNEVARVTGVSKPSLYRYFGDEDGLRAAAIMLYSKLFFAEASEALDSGNNLKESLESYFNFLINRNFNSATPSGCLILDINLQLENHGPKTQEAVADIGRTFYRLIKNNFKRHQEPDKKSEAKDFNALSFFTLSQTYGLASLGSSGSKREHLEEIASLTIKSLV